MKISNQLARAKDDWLFPKPIRTLAETRNICGELIEELTAIIGNGQRLTTDGRCDYCPDVKFTDKVYFETKSCGKNKQAIIYESRREKDRRFNNRRRLVYCFWHHDCSVTGLQDCQQLSSGLIASLRFVVICEFKVVDIVAERFNLKCLNKQYSGGGSELGYGNRSKGYGMGRSIPLSAIISQCNEIRATLPIALHGHAVPSIPVYATSKALSLIDQGTRIGIGPTTGATL